MVLTPGPEARLLGAPCLGCWPGFCPQGPEGLLLSGQVPLGPTCTLGR